MLQPHSPRHGGAWNEASGPSIGERLDCLDQFLDFQTHHTTAVWRPAVVVQHVKEGSMLTEVKVHFEGLSPGHDKWISWPLERNRFAPPGTSSRCTPSPSGGPVGSRDPARSDAEGGDGSSAREVAPTRSRGFSRKIFGAVKSLMDAQVSAQSGGIARAGPQKCRSSRGQANGPSSETSSTGRGTPTHAFALRPPGGSGRSSSPATPAELTVVGAAAGRVGGEEGQQPAPADAAALAALVASEEGKQEEEAEEEDRQLRWGTGEEQGGRGPGRRWGDGGVEESKMFDLSLDRFLLGAAVGEELKEEGEEESQRSAAIPTSRPPPAPLPFYPGAGASATPSSRLPRAPSPSYNGAGNGAACSPGRIDDDDERERLLPLLPLPVTAAAAAGCSGLAAEAVVAPPGEAAAPAVTAAAASAARTPRQGGWRAQIKARARRRGKWGASDADERRAMEVSPTSSAASAAAAEGREDPTQPSDLGGRRSSPGLSPASRTGEDAAARRETLATAALAVPVGASPFSDVEHAPGFSEEGRVECGEKEEEREEAGATAAAAAAAAVLESTETRQPIRDLTPHLIEELEGPGGGFTLTVFRNNKQDEVPVPVPCGKYDTAYEVERAAEAFSSPVWEEPSPYSRCSECRSTFRGGLQRRRHHCRNCGRLVCTSCAMRFWPKQRLPPSYRIDSKELRVRVCRTCYSAGSKFRTALLTGSRPEAMEAYSTGCVNLRAPCGHTQERPVHCAAAGGNVSLLSWLVEDRCCPIFVDQAKTEPLLDSAGRSVMAAAADSGQLEAMRYLAFTQPPSIMNLSLETLWRGLEACFRYDEDDGNGIGHNDPAQISAASRGSASCYALSESGDSAPRDWHNGKQVLTEWRETHGGPAGLQQTAMAELGAASPDPMYSVYELPGSSGGRAGESGSGSSGTGGMRGKTACIVCFSRKVNCTIVPCGHHCCCMLCMEKFDLCPVCRMRITQKVKAIDA